MACACARHGRFNGGAKHPLSWSPFGFRERALRSANFSLGGYVAGVECKSDASICAMTRCLL